MSFLRKKSFEAVKEVGASSNISKTLGAFDLILFGLGGIIGTGVFVFTGLVAAKYSGPAVMISFMIAGATCIFVALAYTELATMLPTSGSVYTYSYVAFGEIFAWMIASIMVLELAISSAVVAVGWSGYLQAILKAANIILPKHLINVPAEGGIINLPAFLIVSFIGFILYLGNKESKRLNAVLVFVKMAAIIAFIVCAVPYFDIKNWEIFVPYGFDNVIYGGSILFFAFTGFGTVATAAEECKNPKRDLTIGIIGSLILATLVYVVIGGLATGIAPFSELDNSQPLAHALELNNNKVGLLIVSIGAICGMPTVIMMNIYGISRIFYGIARDGLLPRSLAKIHMKYESPYLMIMIFASAAAILAGFFPLQILGQLSSMGAIIDYIFIVLVVVVFRIRMPEADRPFKCPAIFIVAPVALIASVYLLFTQIIDKHFNLLITGKLIIYWLVAMLGLYILRYIALPKTKEVAA